MKWLIWLVLGLSLVGCAPERPSAEHLGSAVDCEPLGGECSVAKEGRSIALGLPPEIDPLTRFPVIVRLTGVEARSVSVDFTMKGMDMGVNRFALAPSDGAWSGEAILPVCTTGRTDWIVTVEAVADDEALIEAEFGFQTVR